MVSLPANTNVKSIKFQRLDYFMALWTFQHLI